MNLKWKDIYNENITRRYCEITGIKKNGVGIESNSFRALKEKKLIAIIVVIVLLAIIICAFRTNIKVLLIVMGFFAFAGICFFFFNYFKLNCDENGLYVRFGFQQGLFKYEKIKSVYLSKFNDYSFLIPNKCYSIVIRYTDNYNRIKELSFPTYFITKEECAEFLNNFEIKENQDEKFVQYERFKLLKKIGKIVLIVLFIALLFFVGINSK